MTTAAGKIFQFFNYKTDKDLGPLLNSINESGAVAVFDLEDSKYIPFNPGATERLKESARKIILDKISGVFPENPLTALRVNNPSTAEYKKDIDLLKQLKGLHEFRYLFLPKTESVLSIKQLIQDVEKAGLRLPAIIPIIETKKGAGNLEGIAEFCRLIGVKSIAFGHSDYNLDNGIFPFTHPGSPEFIDLIRPFVKKIENEGLEYVNTPFLYLSDIPLFKKVLADVANICRSGFSQVTLSKLQTVSLRKYQSDPEPSPRLISENALSESERILCAESLIREYETFVNGNTGIVINDKGRVLTPQEYECAKKFLGRGMVENKQGGKKFTLCILGGCLPVQEKIEVSDLYHTLICGYAECEFYLRSEIITERYDTFASVPRILKNTLKANKIDCLIFHVRPDPFLINLKFLAKYVSDNNRKTRKFNLHILGFKEPHVIPVNRGVKEEKRVILRTVLRNANYLLGILVGNRYAASKKYMNLIEEVEELCLQHCVDVIITGPPARPRSILEMHSLKKLGRKLSRKYNNKIAYVDLFYEKDNNGNSLFFKDNIHYNERGHELFADIIYQPLKNMLNKVYKKKTYSAV